MFFQESLRESCSKVEELQQKERERETEREREREREVAREQEREREREREQDLQHSSQALKELETKVRILEQLESQVQVLVERGLVRVQRTPSGQVELQVVSVDPLGSPTGQTSPLVPYLHTETDIVHISTPITPSARPVLSLT